MPEHLITATRRIPAPADRLYRILADYHAGHPAILPKPEFVGLEVEQGGIGAGTVIRVTMKLMGAKGVFRAVVTEPEPGRILAETDTRNGRETRFIVEPLAGGADSCVTIETRSRLPRGPLGWIQGWIMQRLLQPLFARELQLLEARADSEKSLSSPDSNSD